MWSSTDGVYSLTVTILARLRLLLVVLAVAVGVGAPVHAAHSQTKRITITVSAAASLSKAYTELGKQFEKANPSIKVRFNFASTSSLVSQIQSGAPTDVFAAADLTSFDKLLATGNVVKSPKVFARNSMQLIVKRSNPLGISSVSDLAKASIISLCAKTVPCGVYAATVLSRYGVVISESRITRGVDATATLNAVSTGDADAAIVYTTDALSAKKWISVVSIPSGKNVNAMYGIASIRGSQNSKQAEAFVQFVLSPAAQKILKTFGFLAP